VCRAASSTQPVSAHHGRRGKEGSRKEQGEGKILRAHQVAVTQKFSMRQGLTATPTGAARCGLGTFRQGGSGEGAVGSGGRSLASWSNTMCEACETRHLLGVKIIAYYFQCPCDSTEVDFTKMQSAEQL